jgi:hypothetical protein
VIDWFQLQYVGPSPPVHDSRYAPLCCSDLSGLPPALVVRRPALPSVYFCNTLSRCWLSATRSMTTVCVMLRRCGAAAGTWMSSWPPALCTRSFIFRSFTPSLLQQSCPKFRAGCGRGATPLIENILLEIAFPSGRLDGSVIFEMYGAAANNTLRINKKHRKRALARASTCAAAVATNQFCTPSEFEIRCFGGRLFNARKQGAKDIWK